MSSFVPDRPLLGAVALLLMGCASAEQGPSAQNSDAVTASGRIDSASEARFLVAERDAVIKAVHVRPGDVVREGAALVTLSCAAEQAVAAAAGADARAMSATRTLVNQGARQEERAAARARLDEAEALSRDAQAALARAEPLAPRGFVAASQLDTLNARAAASAAAAAAARANWSALSNGPRVAERHAASARAQEAQARAAAASAEVDRCTLRAPIAGTVARILRRAGESSGASTGTPLVVLADLSRLMVRAEIADRDVPRVRLGSRAIITIDGQAGQWTAHVTQLASQMGRRSARSLDPTDRFDRDIREALLTFDGASASAVVGMRVNVEFRR